MIKLLYKSFKINKNYKKYLLFWFITFWLFSIIFFLITIIPTSIYSSRLNTKNYLFSNYKSFAEYTDFAGNELHYDNPYSANSINGNYFQYFSGVEPNNYISYSNPNLNNYLKKQLINGFSTYDNSNLSSKLSRIPLYNHSYSLTNPSLFHELLNYYYKIGHYFPKDHLDDRWSSALLPLYLGEGLEYSGGERITNNFFKALDVYNNSNPFINKFNGFFASNLGTKRIKDPITGKYTYYGGTSQITPITSLSKVLEYSIYQQLPNHFRHIFFTNNFSFDYATVPFNSRINKKFTYVNGSLLNKKDNVQILGFNGKSNLPFYNKKKKNLNSLAIDLSPSQLDTYQNYFNADQLVNTKDTNTIPVVVNNSFIKKYNYKKNDIINYHVDVPRLIYGNYSANTNKYNYYQTDPKNYWFLGKDLANIDLNDDKESNFGTYYLDNGKLNSISFLQQNYLSKQINDPVIQNTNNNTMNFENDFMDKKESFQSNCKLKIVGVYDNDFNLPLIFMNQKIANCINGYSSHDYNTWDGKYLNSNINTTMENYSFNGKISTEKNLNDDNNVLIFSNFGNYSPVGLNGTNYSWTMFSNGKWGYSKQAGNVESDVCTINGVGLDPNEINLVQKLIFDQLSTFGITYIFNSDFIYTEITNFGNIINKIMLYIFIICFILIICISFILFRWLLYSFRTNIYVYKAFGYSNYEIFWELIASYSFISLVAYLISVPFSIMLSYLMVQIIRQQINLLKFTNIIDWHIIVSVFLLIIVIFIIIYLFSYYYINSLSIKKLYKIFQK